MDAETWMSAKKAIELGFADDLLFKHSNEGMAAVEDSFTFSRRAVTNSLLSKVNRKSTPKPAAKAGIPIADLEKRLNLIKP